MYMYMLSVRAVEGKRLILRPPLIRSEESNPPQPSSLCVPQHPNLVSFNSALDAVAKAGQWQEALR
jgi:hypothetical protein